MFYLQDYLESIEELPQELKEKFFDIRQHDLRVHNSAEQLEERVHQFFADAIAKKLDSDQRQRSYEDLLSEWQNIMKYADEKVQIVNQMQDIMVKLIQRLDGELEKFRLELGLAADSYEDEEISSHNNNINGNSHSYSNGKNNRVSYIKEDRRKSEHKHRHHPYHARLSTTSNYSHINNHRPGSKHAQGMASCRQMATPSPTQFNSGFSTPTMASLTGDLSKYLEADNQHHNHNGNIFANGAGVKGSNTKSDSSSLPYSQQHSALSAALASATPHQHNNSSVFSRLSSTSVHNKISMNSKSGNLADPTFVRNNPLTEAASQAIAATQQLQGRKTSSLKASFAAINNGNLDSLDPFGSLQDSVEGNRNALAPMAPGQQAFRYQYGNKNGVPNPLYVSVTKSGRPSKRPKHRASHLYPDESPTSNSSDNSVFENESLSSADFTETVMTFDSNSPASLDYAARGNTTLFHRDETKYCICRQVSYGEMVACDNDECEIEWFHYGCVGITQTPKGKWYCPDCSLKTASQQQQHSNPPHTQKKRGRKEKSVFNLVNGPVEVAKVKDKRSE